MVSVETISMLVLGVSIHKCVCLVNGTGLISFLISFCLGLCVLGTL